MNGNQNFYHYQQLVKHYPTFPNRFQDMTAIKGGVMVIVFLNLIWSLF